MISNFERYRPVRFIRTLFLVSRISRFLLTSLLRGRIDTASVWTSLLEAG